MAFDLADFRRSCLGLFICLFGAPSLLAQTTNQAELEAERKALTERIAATQSLLKSTEDDRNRTTQEWAVLKTQLNLRQQLLSNLSAERKAAERRFRQRQEGVQTADVQLESIKEEYAEMVRIAAKQGGQDQWWQAVLDAEGTTQAFRRLLLIEEYRQTREKQAARIVQSASALRLEMAALETERESLVEVEKDLRSERDAAKNSARQMASLVSDFQTRERELKDQLAVEEARRAELGKAIARLMEAARSRSDRGSCTPQRDRSRRPPRRLSASTPSCARG